RVSRISEGQCVNDLSGLYPSSYPRLFLTSETDHSNVRLIKMARQRPRQLGLDFRTWGGARKGAGRKPTVPGRPGVPHRPRLGLERRLPVHVTVRMAEHVWNLRSRRSFRIIAPAVHKAMDRFEVRLVKFSVQGNHIHLLVEAGDRNSLGRAIK